MNISQRQATIFVLGFQSIAIIILWLIQIFSKNSDNNLTLGAGIAGVVYVAMFFAYIHGWDYARHISVVLITLIVAAFLPEPFVTIYAPFVLLLGPMLALVLLNPLWVIGSAAATIGLLLLRAGGVGVYANLTTLLTYAMLIVGLVVSRTIAETARARVEKTEKALTESEERFRKTFRSVPVGLAITRAADGEYIDANDAFSEITGYSHEELTGQTSLKLNITSPEQRQNYTQQIREQGFINNQEMTLRNKSGESCVVLGSMEIIELNHEICVLSTAIDITGRKRAEHAQQKMHDDLELEFQQRTAALSQANALLETMLEYVPDQVYFKDAKSRFIKNSRSQARALGLNDSTEAVGRTDFDFFPHAQRSFDEEQEIIRSGKTLVDFEEQVVWPDGKETWVSTSKAPLRNQEGQIIGTFGISRDITDRKRAEESLRKAKDELEVRVAERTAELSEANKQLQQTQNIAGLGNYFIDLKTGYWKGSEIFDNLLGIDETFERTMQSWPLLIHANDRQKITDYFTNEVVGKGIRFDKEYRIIRQNDQAERWVHTLGELEVDSQNRPVKMVGTVQDITESKQAKSQLEYQARLLKEINDAVLATDDRYNITVWNHGAEILYGWSAAEALGHNTTEIIRSDMTGAEREEILHQLHETGEYHLELVQYRKDGGPVYVEASTVSIYNESGQVSGFLSINRDITERKQAEEALRESESNARSLIRLSKRLEQAETYSEALGAALEEVKVVLGYQSVWTYLLSEDKQQLRLLTISGEKSQIATDTVPTLTIKGDRFLEEISEGKDIVLVEDARIDSRTNKDIVAQLGNRTIVNVPIIFMDRHLGVFGTGTFGDEGVHVPTSIQLDYLRALASHLAVTLDRIHLLTERKKVEEEIRQLNENLEDRIAERTAQLEIANKELEAFSYSVSHDLRSPLRGIDGWSLALLEDYGGLLDEQGQAHIQRVRAETQRMGMLIDDILQLSRITRAGMNKEKVDLSAIAETVVDRLQETKPEDRQVEFTIQEGLTAMGDPKLLDVVLTNLLGNAFKFTSKKQEAHIEFGETVVEGERAFFVCDNGAGFDMTYANKLFGAFQRMHRASEFPGTGVGLAIVQRVIHRHGGSIWASSEVGQGTTFYFTLEDIN